MKTKYLLVVIYLFSLLISINAEQSYKGRIVGEDRSKIEDVMFQDNIDKESVAPRKIDDLPLYDGGMTDISSEKPQPVSDIDIIGDEKITYTELADTSDRQTENPFERVQPAKPDKPRRMKLIMYNLIGFFVLFAIL